MGHLQLGKDRQDEECSNKHSYFSSRIGPLAGQFCRAMTFGYGTNQKAHGRGQHVSVQVAQALDKTPERSLRETKKKKSGLERFVGPTIELALAILQSSQLIVRTTDWPHLSVFW